VIDNNIAKYTAAGVSAKDSALGVKWLSTQEAVIGMMKPYLSCDKLTELKQPAFAANKNQCGLVEKHGQIIRSWWMRGFRFLLAML